MTSITSMTAMTSSPNELGTQLPALNDNSPALAWKKPRGLPPRPQRQAYCRATQLPKLLPLWPAEIADHTLAGTARIAALLRRALRAERRRGRSGHWTYDLNRHIALSDALKAERAALRRFPGWRAV